MIKSNRVEAINVQFRIWQFDLLVEKSWICFSMTIMLLPLIISTCWLSMVYVRLDLYYKVTGSNDINIVNKEDPVSEAAVPTLLSIVSATLIDLRGIYYLVRYVFCLKPNWRPRIKLDSRYGVMQLSFHPKLHETHIETHLKSISKCPMRWSKEVQSQYYF